jgi:hypothetical protein
MATINYLFHIYILILFILPSLQTPKSIQIPFKLSNNIPFITIELGSPPQTLSLPLNLHQKYTWFPSTIAPFTQSKTSSILHTGKIKIENTLYTSKELSDIITLESTYSNIPYHFYVIDINNYETYNTGYGFNYIYDNNNFNLIYQLYKKQYISHSCLSIRNINDTNSIYFGVLPQETVNTYTYKAKCKVKNKMWSCNYGNSVIMYNKTFTNKYDMIFQMNTEYIYIPVDFYDYLQKEVFNITDNANSQCKIEKDSQSNEFIICNRKYIEQTFQDSSFTFVLGDYQVDIKLPKIIICNDNVEDLCQIGFVFNYKRAMDKWIYGNIFLRNIDIVFDYHEGLVILYSDNDDIVFTQITNNEKFNDETYYININIVTIKKMILFIDISLSFVLVYLLLHFLLCKEDTLYSFDTDTLGNSEMTESIETLIANNPTIFENTSSPILPQSTQ